MEWRNQNIYKKNLDDIGDDNDNILIYERDKIEIIENKNDFNEYFKIFENKSGVFQTILNFEHSSACASGA